MSDKSEPAKPKPGFFRRLFTRTEEAPSAPATADDSATPIDILPDAPPDASLDRELAALDDVATIDGGIVAEDAAVAVPDEQAESSAAVPESESPAPPPAAAAPPAPQVAAEPEWRRPPLSDIEPAQPAAEAPLETAASIEPRPADPAAKRSWWTRLREGLARSSSTIGTGITDIFTKRKLDDAMIEELEDVLIRADLGVATTIRICEAVAKGRYNKDVDPDEVKAVLASEVERVLAPHARPIAVAARKPFVILVVGVNGSGKTTTIGKLAAKLTGEGKQVMLAAGDTFRAAAIAQLQIWGDRFGCTVVAREQGSDAAGLAFEAIEQARAAGADVLLVDTAGRLQNRTELMAELEKIIRVMRKLDAEAPHAVLLVLDATVGQNAMSQVEIFGKVAGVTGLVMTKLDGTARGGILVAITEKFQLPVHFIGVGETADDLEPFAARDFAAAIAGIEQHAQSRRS